MIEIRHLTKIYDGTPVVDDVSMTVPAGSVTVVVGTSGSGKSTLLRMINRLVTPSAGTVLIDGRDTASLPGYELRRAIGYVIQGYGLFPHRTVAQNIATVPRLVGWNRRRIGERVEELLSLFQLDPALYADKYPHQLSGGEQQRVGVARALAAEPRVLLMDEPFGALDPIIRAKAQDDLAAIQRRFGTTIVMVTHDMDEAFRLGDRIAVMSEGRVLQDAVPAAILARPQAGFVEQLVGTADRPFRLLSLARVGDSVEPGDADGPALAPDLTLRDALARMVWLGADALPVEGSRGRVTVAGILARGRSPDRSAVADGVRS